MGRVANLYITNSNNNTISEYLQRERLKKYAEEHDYIINEISFYDKKCIEDIIYGKKPSLDAILVYNLNSVLEDELDYYYYYYELLKKNISIISVTDNEKNSESNSKVLEVLEYACQKESSMIQTRVGSARNAKAASGKYSGGRVPYGYMLEAGKLVPNPEEVAIVWTVFEKHRENMNRRAIARFLNENGFKTRNGKDFIHSGVKSIIDNEKFYQGYYRYGDMEYVKGEHEPIL